MRPIRTEDDIYDLSRATTALATIAGWSKLGLFHVLADGKPKKIDELPADARALRVTVPILAHLGLLSRDGDTIAFTATAKKLYDEGALGLYITLDNLDDLSRINEVLAKGGPARTRDGQSKATEGGVREEDVPRARAFMEMLYRRSATSARETALSMSKRLPQGAHVLDVGGGHGRYGRELVELGHRATLFDKNVCIDFARELHGKALEYRAGDFFRDDLGGPYDAALLSNIVHGFSLDENRRLVAKLSKVIQPGGYLVMKDMFIDDLGADPENAVTFGMTMLLYTNGGQSYTVAEMDSLCRPEGFAPIESASFGEFTLLFARKEAQS